MRSTLKWILLVVIVAVIGYFGWHWWTGQAKARTVFKTAPVRRGNLMATVSATGTLEPREVVDIGAEVSGTIISFGKDAVGQEVDYDSPVRKGTVLARIDPALFAAAVAQAKANLAQAQANVQVAQAKLEGYQAAYVDALADWQRAQKIGTANGALAITQYDAYKSTADQAKANVVNGQASLVAARAAVQAAQATLDTANINLAYCTITSPVNGVVIDRRVNIGQTVASSFSTPSLFLIAENLDRIQVWASVNEADIGRIKVGDPVTFTIDAFPNQTFHGKVSQVRLNATMVQNVVTYTVVVDTGNPGGKLLPYLTAQTDFLVAQRKNVLMVPNAALRWVPLQSQILPTATTTGHSTATKPAPIAKGATGRGTLWVVDGAYVRPVSVDVGLANDYDTEIISDQVKPGMEVVVGERQAGSTSSSGTNPFIPHPFAHNKKAS